MVTPVEQGHLRSEENLAIRVLLVTNDDKTIDTLSQVMGASAINVQVAPDADAATRELCRNKYEAVMVDFDHKDESLALLRKQRATTSNRNAVVWGIVNSDKDRADVFRAGAHFVISRPLSRTVLGRTLKVSYPLMIREKRRYHRLPLYTQVFVSSAKYPEFVANAINISEGGIAIDGVVPVQVGDRLSLRLKLPGYETGIQFRGEVCWYDRNGRVGLQFIDLPDSLKQEIQQWVSERLDACLASHVAGD
ncbi:MAG TPA: PilZ domain-containing protein [Terriglobales bacterium]|nr:PilZ domain-containing protein [Terriglobales bacterium]